MTRMRLTRAQWLTARGLRKWAALEQAAGRGHRAAVLRMAALERERQAAARVLRDQRRREVR